MIMSESISDTELQEINNLTWLPWIGENYAGLARDEKILLIGESHYYGEGESNHDKDQFFTRKIIKRVIDKGTTTNEIKIWKFFISTIRLLIPGSSLSKEQERKLWSNVAFYNFVQRSVRKNDNKDKPSKDDFYKGWPPFFKLVKVINPAVCIFLGASSAQQFSKANQTLKQNITLSKDKKINGAWARSGTFSSDNGNIELVFIKHPSSRFSTNLWREYLEEKILPQHEWLKNSINT